MIYVYLLYRSFYKKQDDLIDAFENLSKTDTWEEGSEEEGEEGVHKRKKASMYARITLAVNFVSLCVTSKII